MSPLGGGCVADSGLPTTTVAPCNDTYVPSIWNVSPLGAGVNNIKDAADKRSVCVGFCVCLDASASVAAWRKALRVAPCVLRAAVEVAVAKRVAAGAQARPVRCCCGCAQVPDGAGQAEGRHHAAVDHAVHLAFQPAVPHRAQPVHRQGQVNKSTHLYRSGAFVA